MYDLPLDWGALCPLVFLLGLRHGLEADHLAAIDGLTRLSAHGHFAHSRYCGALFSLGHGGVVLSIAMLAGMLGSDWVPPMWFEALGGGISNGFLLLIGYVNLLAVLGAPLNSPVPMVGVRGRLVSHLLGRTMRTSSPLAVMGVGSLFALSLDTISQSVLFAVMAMRFGGVPYALTLGLLFVSGMLVSGGANGLLISHLIERTDRLAAVASHAMTLGVAFVSLLVALIGLGRLTSGWLNGHLEGHQLLICLSVVVLIGLGYFLAVRMASAPSPSPVTVGSQF